MHKELTMQLIKWAKKLSYRLTTLFIFLETQFFGCATIIITVKWHIHIPLHINRWGESALLAWAATAVAAAAADVAAAVVVVAAVTAAAAAADDDNNDVDENDDDDGDDDDDNKMRYAGERTCLFWIL